MLSLRKRALLLYQESTSADIQSEGIWIFIGNIHFCQIIILNLIKIMLLNQSHYKQVTFIHQLGNDTNNRAWPLHCLSFFFLIHINFKLLFMMGTVFIQHHLHHHVLRVHHLSAGAAGRSFNRPTTWQRRLKYLLTFCYQAITVH